MKILIVHYTDGGGGGAIAPLRLYEALRAKGVLCDFGVIEKKSENENIFCIKRKYSFLKKIIHKLYHYFARFLFKISGTENGILHSLNLYSLADIDFINKSDYDIVHLHWIGANTLSIKDIAKINKPLCWTMHDSWAVCGAEHHPNTSYNDTRYIEGYTKKNRAKGENGFDLCRWIFNKKKKYFRFSTQFIGPSLWETEVCKNSYLFKHLPTSSVTHIPNIIDTNCFKSLDKNTVRNIFEINTDKKVLMFSTPYFSSKKTDMKGTSLLLQVLEHFFKNADTSEFVLLMTGNINADIKKFLPQVQTIFTGFIQNPRLMNLCYNVTDVLLFPSRIENLPYGLLEPQSIGIPCVAFDTGGNSDIVVHKQTGYLAPCFDTKDFANGINYCFENKTILGKNAISHIKENFDSNMVVEKHIELYKKILNEKRK